MMRKLNFKNIITVISGLMLLLLGINTTVIQAQDADKFIRSGNKYYADSNFQAAELKYTKALETNPNSEKGLFNQGNSYYEQQKYEEALQNYEMTAELMQDPKDKAAAYHNLGNAYFKGQQFDKSVDAYKNALRLQPNDLETKYNLALAKKMLEQQQQNQQDQQNQDQQNQDQQDQQDQDKQDQDQQNQDEQNQDQQNQDQQNQDKGDQNEQQSGEENPSDQQEQNEGQQGKEGENEEKGEQQQMVMPSKLSKEEVERILEALANDEVKVQEKLIEKKTPPNAKKSDKDW